MKSSGFSYNGLSNFNRWYCSTTQNSRNVITLELPTCDLCSCWDGWWATDLPLKLLIGALPCLFDGGWVDWLNGACWCCTCCEGIWCGRLLCKYNCDWFEWLPPLKGWLCLVKCCKSFLFCYNQNMNATWYCNIITMSAILNILIYKK